MEALQSALDSLAAEDLHPLFGPEVMARVAALVRAQNQLAAELTRTVREAEVSGGPEVDGARTMRSWLIGRGGLTPKAATQLVTNGRALPHLPSVAAGFADGGITADRVAVIAPVASERNLAAAAAQGVDLAGIETGLAAVAAAGSIVDLAGVVQQYLDGLDPDGPEPDPTENRSLVVVEHADGWLSGRFLLDPVGGEKLQAALESSVQADRPAGDTRTRTQQLGDALVQIADGQLASGRLPVLRTVKPTVVVTVPLQDLVDPATADRASPDTAVARSGFGAWFSAARTRMLACDSAVIRMVFGPGSTPLDVGRSMRVVPAHIRRAVEHRDRHCVFAGCRRQAHHCDVHHVVHWIDDGPTSLDNSALLCERHHTQVHHGFTIVRDECDRWHTYRPDGREILPDLGDRPPLARPGAPPRVRPGALLSV
ncbi:DUF222 domain-containing protein [Modestobacter sp. I12A-02628]|uniref:DUF222 domain-containing protein n=1 Tax=Goekera deserti TaxID=2497753 RepID=A0A7K3WGD9_9ACTN|nr:DUF222 domain-containing protein [Goekera deserti]MPQ96590.1 DUF222 domain-containing protein [Goekera deserti]NDI47098.1 DUF222 domain-containing protein [Goekera deserti]NEL55504.1 DUF222 domain-containing protein [Goekera deserti]